MNLLRTIAAWLVAEWRAQQSGHRALREFRFAKYRIRQADAAEAIRERLLRRLARGSAPKACATATTS